MIENRGGQYHGNAYQKIRKIADKGSACSLDEKLHEHLEHLTAYSRHGTEIKREHEYGKLADIQLIEGRSKGQGNLEAHENATKGGKHCRKRELFRSRNRSDLLGKNLFFKKESHKVQKENG